MTNVVLLFGLSMSQINDDERVVFFPTYGIWDEEKQVWTIAIHGNIHEPETASLKRRAVISGVRRSLDIEPDSNEARIFARRARLFLVDNEGDKTVKVRLAGSSYQLQPSGSNGHFHGTVTLPVDHVPDRSANVDERRCRWLGYRAELPPGDQRRFSGQVQLIPPQGISVISDIDDTIKDTNVTNRQAMLANTLMKDFRAVPGMARLYERAAARGVAIHYVSGSPWQLYAPLSAFLRTAGFPDASYRLKHFRLKDSSMVDLLRSQKKFKPQLIEEILAAFPARRFVLVGDSGEQDPEIYGEIARRHKQRAIAIFIRNVTEETADNDRMSTAFQGIDKQQWRLFEDGTDLEKAFIGTLPD